MVLPELPDDSVDPPFRIAGRTDKKVLHLDFGRAAIASPAQAVAALEFADGALDGNALAALRLKGRGALFGPAGLQRTLVLAAHQAAVPQPGRHALRLMADPIDDPID